MLVYSFLLNHMLHLHKLFCILKQCLPRICKIRWINLEHDASIIQKGIFITGQEFEKNFWFQADDHRILLFHSTKSWYERFGNLNVIDRVPNKIN